MVHRYSQSAGVVAALIKTFDGKHPCTLCGKVKEGRQKQKGAQTSVEASKKIDVLQTSAADSLQQQLFENFSFPNDKVNNLPPGYWVSRVRLTDKGEIHLMYSSEDNIYFSKK